MIRVYLVTTASDDSFYTYPYYISRGREREGGGGVELYRANTQLELFPETNRGYRTTSNRLRS